MSEAPRLVTRLERLAPWLAGALIALPVLLTHYPPMADLPLHEAVVGILRHWGDPRYVPPNVYELNLGQGNQLFYFLILPLTYVLPIGTATKILVALAVFCLPVAAAHLADYLGVTRWAAVVVAPIGLGWMFFWGLLANMIGLDAYLFALPLLDRFCERPTRRGFAAVCGWAVLLHFAHDLMALIAGGTLIVLTVCSWRGWRENVVRLLPAGLVVALALSTRIITARITNKYHAQLPDFTWYPFVHKVWSVPGALYAGYEPWVRTLIFVVCLIPVALFGIERWRLHTPETRTRREWLHDFRFEILSASLLFAYCLAPVNMKGTTLIYHRFLHPAWILLTLTACTRARPLHPWRLPRLLAAFVPLAPLLTAWPRFVDSDRDYRDLDAAIAYMQPNSSTIVLELGPIDHFLLYNPVTGGGHITAVLGGRGFFDFTHSESSPVYERTEKQWIHGFQRMDGHSSRMMPSYDLTRYRYAILHTSNPNIAELATQAMAPDARMVVRRGQWTVLESTLPLVPIDSPDEPTPTPHAKTLRKRCLELAEEREKLPADDQALPPDTQPPLLPEGP